MNILVLVVMVWLFTRLLNVSAEKKVVVRPAPKKGGNRYTFSPARSQALALAHPLGTQRLGEAYLRPTATLAANDPRHALRPLLLHLFGLRSDMSDAQIVAVLAPQLRRRWFRIGLEQPRAQDNGRDAMAFACARLAFALRAANLLGWIDEATQWQLLQQNAERAAQCFHGWADFGACWLRGRRQWVEGSRADSLWVAFTLQESQRWSTTRGHPWRDLPWPSAAPA